MIPRPSGLTVKPTGVGQVTVTFEPALGWRTREDAERDAAYIVRLLETAPDLADFIQRLLDAPVGTGNGWPTYAAMYDQARALQARLTAPKEIPS
jgi:hypothetical protein